MNGHEEHLAYEEALDALRRLLLEPAGVPAKVATAALRAVLPAGGPAATMLDRWGRETGRGRMAGLAAEAARAVVGTGDPNAFAPLEERWGTPARFAVLGAAALARIEDRRLGLTDVIDRYPVPRTLARGSGDVGRRLRRAFGDVPPVWRVLGVEHPALVRWWWLHEAAFRPTALVGDEPWIVAGAVSESVEASGLAATYRRMLERFGHPEGVAFDEAASAGRPGLAELAAAAAAYAVGTLDEGRLRLASARLGSGREGGDPAEDGARVVGLVRGLSVFAPADRAAADQPKKVRATS